MYRIAETLGQHMREGRPVALATVIYCSGPTSCAIGAKIIVTSQGVQGSLGWKALEDRVTTDAQAALAQKRTYTADYAFGSEYAPEGGAAEVLIEVFVPAPTLLIVGAGHIAVPLARMGKILDFQVVVLDDRASFANKERFPEADRVIAAGFEETLRRFPLTNNTYIVLVTRGHAHDVPCLKEVIDSPAAYIGMIGSRRRVWAVFKLLHDDGMPTAKLGRVYAPIGLDIGAETPGEIAASIIAEIVKIQRGGRVESISDSLREKYLRLLDRGLSLE